MNPMESPEHKHLKNVAVLWLLNQGCFLADTEVALSQVGLRRYTDFDNKTIVDAVGVGLRFRAENGKTEGSEDFDPQSLAGSEAGECVLRGIEVKVTRGDFRAGFACSGCNYHYLLTPLRLLAPSEVPKGIGLIEYNKHKWGCEPDDSNPDRPYKITGLRVLKHPIYRELPRFQVDGAVSHLAQRTLQQTRQRALQCLDRFITAEAST
jgi:hypothetical protein